jgi:hypothetical protein
MAHVQQKRPGGQRLRSGRSRYPARLTVRTKKAASPVLRDRGRRRDQTLGTRLTLPPAGFFGNKCRLSFVRTNESASRQVARHDLLQYGLTDTGWSPAPMVTDHATAGAA